MKLFNRINACWLALIIGSFALLAILIQAGIIDSLYEMTLVSIGINIILGLGLNLILGVSGQFSLGHAGFMAIGAYSLGISYSQDPTLKGFVIGILIGLVLSGIVAVLVGIPTLRLKGDYLAIATLGVAEIIRVAIVNMNITNGAAGLSGIPLFESIPMWQLVFLFVIITALVVVNYVRSGSGRATLAIRENEIAAESVGVNTTKYKVIAFVIGAMTASIAGALYASYYGTIVPDNFNFMKSVDILIIVVFGGMGSVTGTFVAGILLGILNTLLQDAGDLRMIIYSLALIIIMIFKPSGLLGSKEFLFSKIFTKKKAKNKKGESTDDTIRS
ncbi:branched-chain amino acid ABC transporter permease [Vagococcus entomophilus]|uniref:Branched-chain amino acid ABC transporter permease n=1 Tax=Vagococcus entomophilus TaxID=1160095 RepID=A0A430AJT8_9ENTE|nr:branched-chain amino acid ABC transporter permease [Vagococcus entomophilus]RSU08372.1 branched-chain amino acid ABC transporter permease [Vagococcus entomophilus]